MGLTWGPSGADRTQVGPMLAPWTLLSGETSHGVASPSRVDVQWNILCRGSKWTVHTVCLVVAGCGLRQPLFSLRLPTFALPRVEFLFAVGPQYQQRCFCQKCHLKDTHKIFNKQHVGLKLEWRMQHTLISWEPFSIWGFFSCPFDVLLGVTCVNMLVATQWPQKRATHLISLTSFVEVCVVRRSESSLGALCLLW